MATERATGETADSLDAFVHEAEESPLLFRKRVIAGIVLAFAALVAGYFVASAIFGFSTEVDARPFREWVERRGALGPLVFIAFMAFSVLFAPIPNVPIFIAAGLIWGSVLGTAYSVAGLMIGSCMAFYVSRLAGRRYLAKLVGHRLAGRMDRMAETMGGRVIFWARMLPAVNFDWVSFVAGVTAIRFRTFVVSSFLGFLLPTFISVTAGDGLGSDFRLTLAMGGLWLLGIIGSAAYFWRRRARRPRGVAPPVAGDRTGELGKARQ